MPIADHPDTADGVEELVQQLHTEINAVAAEAEQDPLEHAFGAVEAWEQREAERTRRRVAAANRIGQYREFGALADDQDAMAAVNNFHAATRDARRRLAYVIENAVFRSPRESSASPHSAGGLLQSWWNEVVVLIGALRRPSLDAQRIVAQEVDRWFRARAQVWAAILTEQGFADLPRPEDPAGLIAGDPALRVGAVIDWVTP